jgi:hypothetical protein
MLRPFFLPQKIFPQSFPPLSISSLLTTIHRYSRPSPAKKVLSSEKPPKPAPSPSHDEKPPKFMHHVQAFDKGSQKWQENYPQS